jgi:hypothetical protein
MRPRDRAIRTPLSGQLRFRETRLPAYSRRAVARSSSVDPTADDLCWSTKIAGVSPAKGFPRGAGAWAESGSRPETMALPVAAHAVTAPARLVQASGSSRSIAIMTVLGGIGGAAAVLLRVDDEYVARVELRPPCAELGRRRLARSLALSDTGSAAVAVAVMLATSRAPGSQPARRTRLSRARPAAPGAWSTAGRPPCSPRNSRLRATPPVCGRSKAGTIGV